MQHPKLPPGWISESVFMLLPLTSFHFNFNCYINICPHFTLKVYYEGISFGTTEEGKQPSACSFPALFLVLLIRGISQRPAAGETNRGASWQQFTEEILENSKPTTKNKRKAHGAEMTLHLEQHHPGPRSMWDFTSDSPGGSQMESLRGASSTAHMSIREERLVWAGWATHVGESCSHCLWEAELYTSIIIHLAWGRGINTVHFVRKTKCLKS